MSYPLLKRIYPADRQLQQVEQNVAEALQPVLTQVDGPKRLISGVKLASASPTAINHGLGRTLQGYHVVLRSANAVVWDDQATNSFTDKTLILRTSADCTVSVLVF